MWRGPALANTGTIPPEVWEPATTEAAEPVPTCLGSPGYGSLWYTVAVPEASVLEVSVTSDDNGRFQPVVQILTADFAERACGLTPTEFEAQPPAYASAYVREGTYLVRVARVSEVVPVGVRPTLKVSVSGLDVTPPEIKVTAPDRPPPLRRITRYSAKESTDSGALLNLDSIRWTFVDGGRPRQTRRVGEKEDLAAEHAWRTAGVQKVSVELEDLASNKATYTFFVTVADTDPPEVIFGVTAVPFPKSRSVKIKITFRGTTFLRLRVTQRSRSLLTRPRVLSFFIPEGAKATRTRAIRLNARVRAGSPLNISGVAVDKAGNVAELPLCVLDPDRGGGRCFGG